MMSPSRTYSTARKHGPSTRLSLGAFATRALARVEAPGAYQSDRPADLRPGDIDTRLVSFVDFAPMILNLAGVDLPGYLQGQDFTDTQVPTSP